MEKVSSVSIRETVFNQLRFKILNGDLKPGEKLIESNLAERLGVSRTPVREALHKLELEGLVEIFPRRHCLVKGIDYARVKEINLIRSLLEPAAAKEAVKHLTVTDLDYLERLLQQSEVLHEINEVGNLMKIHDEFHQVIIRSSRLPYLVQMIENLHDYIVRFRKSFLSRPELVERSIQEHKKILEALKAKDENKVEQLFKSHIEGIQEYAEVVIEDEYHKLG